MKQILDYTLPRLSLTSKDYEAAHTHRGAHRKRIRRDFNISVSKWGEKRALTEILLQGSQFCLSRISVMMYALEIVDLMNDFLSLKRKRNTFPFQRFISSGNWK